MEMSSSFLYKTRGCKSGHNFDYVLDQLISHREFQWISEGILGGHVLECVGPVYKMWNKGS